MAGLLGGLIGKLTGAPGAARAPTSEELRRQGNVALEQGQVEEAQRCYREAVIADPRDALAHLNLGFISIEREQLAAAIASLEECISLAPPSAGFLHEAHFLVGRARSRQLDGTGALRAYGEALRLSPGFGPALEESARVLDSLGRHEEALASAEQWTDAGGGATARVFAAHQLYRLRRHEEALAWLDALLHDEPGSAEAARARGHVLLGLNRHAEAVAAFESAVATEGPSAELLAELGGVQQRAGRLADADNALSQALRLDPANVVAACNAVHLKTEQLRLAEAIELAREALRKHPQDADLHWNLGIALLLHGRLAEGFAQYEWRWQRGLDAPLQPDPGIPRWDGSPMPEGTLLLFAEQGFGDTLQFLRYLPWVTGRVRRVVLRIPESLRALARELAAGCEVITESSAVPAFHRQCSLLSLPLLAGTDIDSVPAAIPYLRADPAGVRAWAQRLQAGTPRMAVGIAWSGNPAHLNDRNRSIPLEQFATIGAAPCRFASLQPGVRDPDLGAYGRWQGLLRFGEDLRDFADTAALMEALDLVITVDTSVAHLAGALGRPVWLLLPHAPDWRWMLDRDDTPWYPTMRLFRQRTRGDWAEVLSLVREALVAAAASRVTPPASA